MTADPEKSLAFKPKDFARGHLLEIVLREEAITLSVKDVLQTDLTK